MRAFVIGPPVPVDNKDKPLPKFIYRTKLLQDTDASAGTEASQSDGYKDVLEGGDTPSGEEWDPNQQDEE